MGWEDGMAPGRALFGGEAVWSEDVPDVNICVRWGDPVPKNFMDGVRPRWDERLARCAGCRWGHGEELRRMRCGGEEERGAH